MLFPVKNNLWPTLSGRSQLHWFSCTGRRSCIPFRGNSGNIIVPVNGGGDFVDGTYGYTRSTKGVKPQLLADRITSDGTTILGVDDRGGISAILWALRQAVEQRKQ